MAKGEEAFLQLFETLVEHDVNVSGVKSARTKISNTHYAVDGEIVIGPDLPRVQLKDVPSPYLMGMMDKFFDDKLSPLIHTTRGRPLLCAFCTEGADYCGIVNHRLDTLARHH